MPFPAIAAQASMPFPAIAAQASMPFPAIAAQRSMPFLALIRSGTGAAIRGSGQVVACRRPPVIPLGIAPDPPIPPSEARPWP